MTECPSLTELPPNPPVITVDMLKYLIVNTYSRSVGTVVTVRCQPGLTLVGPSSVTCMQSGHWSADPYCKMPNEVTTATPTSNEEENTMILIIVLGVVGFLVAALIIFVCVALYCGRRGNKKTKQYRDSSEYYLEDGSSHPYSLSRKVDDNNPRHNMNETRHFHDYPDRYRYYENNTEEYNNQLRDDGQGQHQGYYDHRYQQREDKRHTRSKFNRFRTDVDHMRQAYSLNDLDDEKQYETQNTEGDEDKHIRDIRRDRYLWRRRSSISNLNIPRPYYSSNKTPYNAVYYAPDFTSPYI
ncbi:uncharacterized protein LOC132717104 [Ruditapes philippinarum]|uniref:uncharacterized protein LOC132717104 n=1 Tax=Ruditapes philippinarum TaxID=129788 RepID=UPI00295B51BE|nr:uncharacterized protein LOC132717104 [Ruditapes philippinarum]